jgi:acyl-CoA reductase-like NAD-dependent aldehyde dehydrogenase
LGYHRPDEETTKIVKYLDDVYIVGPPTYPAPIHATHEIVYGSIESHNKYCYPLAARDRHKHLSTMLKMKLRGLSINRLARSFSQGSAVVDNPYTGNVHCTVPFVNESQADEMVTNSKKVQNIWAGKSLDDRIKVVNEFIDAFQSNSENIAQDISGMMGKPVAHARGEVKGAITRAKVMMELAPAALQPRTPPLIEGFHRKLVREPVGVVLTIAPWNYPLLTAVNSVVPAVLAGNSVLLKHSPRTPLCANHFETAFNKTSAPTGLVSALHCSNDMVERVYSRPEVGFVQFTGSVATGRIIYSGVAKKRFIDVGLELGGKDAAYVHSDANLDDAVGNLVDGALFNAGQSCCGIERVYVHSSIYEEFLKRAQAVYNSYPIGDPQDPQTQVGPMAQPQAIPFLTKQVEEAVAKGARLLRGGKSTTDSTGRGRFFAPTLLADCTHDMSVMKEESFAPIMAVMSVDNPAHALQLMNDSSYGLTAVIWSDDPNLAHEMAPKLQVGTVFLNRCDYLDPYLAWTGQKDTGKGYSLSQFGFDAYTRIKSIHFKHPKA